MSLIRATSFASVTFTFAGGAALAQNLLEGIAARVGNIHAQATELVKTLPTPDALCPRLRHQVRRALAPMRAAGSALADNFARQSLAAVEKVLTEVGLPQAQKLLSDAAGRFREEWQKTIARFDTLTDSTVPTDFVGMAPPTDDTRRTPSA